MLLGYGAKVGLGNMRVKAENRMVTLNGTDLLLLCEPSQYINLVTYALIISYISSFQVLNFPKGS